MLFLSCLQLYIFSISEGEPSGTIVGEVAATDPDEGENGRVTFSLVDFEQEEASKLFQVNQKGEIKTNAMLDRETKDIYRFRVMAQDHGLERRKCFANVTVIVNNKNDEQPRILSDHPQNSTVFVSPYEEVGFKFYRIQAEDPDDMSADKFQGVFPSLSFLIASGNSEKLFFLDPSSGEISLNRPPDRKEYGPHLVKILVNDTDNVHSVEGIVRIIIDPNQAPLSPSKARSGGGKSAAVSGWRLFNDSPSPVEMLLLVGAFALFIIVLIASSILLMCIRRNPRGRINWHPCTGPNKEAVGLSNGALSATVASMSISNHHGDYFRSTSTLRRLDSPTTSGIFSNREAIQYMGIPTIIEVPRESRSTLSNHSNHSHNHSHNRSHQASPRNLLLHSPRMGICMLEHSPPIKVGQEDSGHTPPSGSYVSQQSDSGLNLSKVFSNF